MNIVLGIEDTSVNKTRVLTLRSLLFIRIDRHRAKKKNVVIAMGRNQADSGQEVRVTEGVTLD